MKSLNFKSLIEDKNKKINIVHKDVVWISEK